MMILLAILNKARLWIWQWF